MNPALPIIKAQVPEQFRSAITNELVNKIEELESNPVFAEQIRDNLVTYIGVLRDNPASMDDYLRLITYVTSRMKGDNSLTCYAKAYPERYAALVKAGKTEGEIRRHAGSIEKGKMYVSLMQQVIVPSWILNYDAYQSAVRTQLEIMQDDTVSPMVRTQAANSLLTHLSKPKEAANITLNQNTLNANVDDLGMLRNMLSDLSNRQHKTLITGAASTKDVINLTAIQDSNDEPS